MATGIDSATIPSMGRKRADKPTEPADDKGAVKRRIGVNFTSDWHAVIRKLAGKRKMPVLWYLIELAREDAAKNGVTDLPAPPWEDDTDAE